MPIKFAFLVLPQIHLMDLAGPDQTILEAMDYGAEFKIEYYGLGDGPQTTAGLNLGKTKPFKKAWLQAGDYLILPGSSVDFLMSKSFLQNEVLFKWLRNQYANGVHLVSVCAGAFVLGLAGLLDGRRCTTHFKRTAQLQKRFPLARVEENMLFVEDEGIFTSAGIASGIDLMLHIVERLQGSYFAHKVARELVIYNRRDGNQKQQSALLQFRNHIHSGIHLVQDYLIEHTDRKHRIVDLAEMANMSERNFTRIFKQETGTTVIQFLNSIRAELARQWMKNPDLSKIQIAAKLGLRSERQLNRILQE